MTPKNLGIIYTIITALIAGFAVLPYSWAHFVATGMSTLLALIHGGTTVALIAVQKANSQTGKGQ